MRFSSERCLGPSCGTPVRPTSLNTKYELIDRTGQHKGTDFWFCSEECYEAALNKYIPKEYAIGKDVSDHPGNKETIDRVWNEHHGDDIYEGTEESDKLDRALFEAGRNFARQFYKDQSEANSTAQGKLRHRLLKEAQIIRDEQEEKDRIAREKEEAKAEQVRMAREEEERRLEPREIPERIRLEHTHILAPSGSGKTQFIINRILTDHENNKNPPAIIFIDPKGIAVETLSKVRDLKDRLVIVDPLQKPALSLFDAQGRTPTQLISDFAYIFSTTNQDLTGKQSPCFSFCAQLLFTIPKADLLTFLDLLDDRTDKKKPPNPIFLDAISKLPPVARRFFETDYYASNYAATREQIKSRIWGVLNNEILTQILNAKVRKLDLARCIRKRKTVLITTRMTQLKEAHQVLGRYLISLVQDAIQNRTERHPVYLIIDEFQEFADENKTPQMLRLIREFGGGVTIAHQNMYCREINEGIRSAISTNTSIKYAASPEAADLTYMAKDLRCTPEFLKKIHKSEEAYSFACFVRGLVPPLQHPFVIHERFGWSNYWPQMSDAEYGQMKSVNDFQLQHWPQIEERQRLASEPKQKELKKVALMTGEEHKSLKVETLKTGADSQETLNDPAASPDDDNKPTPWKRK
ncbi:MAG TPA: type IV secretion system DNA-binding domain-containing protein [Blastocatellia bacterium]|nr:type IV secretion system DNA-binding domain-containing protein [Blastocatellia bacterium]